MKLRFILCLIASLLFSSAQSQSIVINKGKVTIGKTTLTPDWKLEDARKGFGPGAGYVQGYTNVHDLENAGARIYEAGTSGIVSEIDVFMTEAEGEVKNAAGVFKGSLKIDGKKIEVVNTPVAVKNLLPLWKSAECYGEYTYKYVSNGIYLYFQFTANEKKIYAINFGKIKPQE